MRSREVVNKDGGVDIRSMIFTEYFVKGHSPPICVRFTRRRRHWTVAGMFGGASRANLFVRRMLAFRRPKPAPPAPPPLLTAFEVVRGATADANAEPQKKRGFWAGFRRDNEIGSKDQDQRRKKRVGRT
jgi:hypothetical protein